eukprot:7385109-Prymnesium_polylepis.2
MGAATGRAAELTSEDWVAAPLPTSHCDSNNANCELASESLRLCSIQVLGANVTALRMRA